MTPGFSAEASLSYRSTLYPLAGSAGDNPNIKVLLQAPIRPHHEVSALQGGCRFPLSHSTQFTPLIARH
jgi:hypothetical protein